MAPVDGTATVEVSVDVWRISLDFLGEKAEGSVYDVHYGRSAI